jgi:lipopolysaccharide/colanic/teichoic acid biosynthesis glycosyltransferase
MKRAFDIIVALLGLVLLAPLILVLACAILLDDPGPIIYRGQRVGRGGREFRILKFRSMHAQPSVGSELTVSGDPRVTRVGRLLRATKLDELPQLMNVLRGQMSLVGPRPESPQYVALYTPEQRGVLRVRPGITGKATIYFRHEERLLVGPDPQGYYTGVVMPAKLAMDLDYVAHRSFRGDLKLIGLTFLALVRPLPEPALPGPASPAEPVVHANPSTHVLPHASRDERALEPALKAAAGRPY